MKRMRTTTELRGTVPNGRHLGTPRKNQMVIVCSRGPARTWEERPGRVTVSVAGTVKPKLRAELHGDDLTAARLDQLFSFQQDNHDNQIASLAPEVNLVEEPDNGPSFLPVTLEKSSLKNDDVLT